MECNVFGVPAQMSFSLARWIVKVSVSRLHESLRCRPASSSLIEVAGAGIMSETLCNFAVVTVYEPTWHLDLERNGNVSGSSEVPTMRWLSMGLQRPGSALRKMFPDRQRLRPSPKMLSPRCAAPVATLRWEGCVEELSACETFGAILSRVPSLPAVSGLERWPLCFTQRKALATRKKSCGCRCDCFTAARFDYREGLGEAWLVISSRS